MDETTVQELDIEKLHVGCIRDLATAIKDVINEPQRTPSGYFTSSFSIVKLMVLKWMSLTS
jgi:hypothetical protein